MPSIINAATSGGLISTADTSGILQLQTASTTALTINASQQVQVNTGGSASAPVISKSDDTNTGIFFPAADTIAFAEGGTESMRIDSAGNVGIGVAPSNWGSAYKALQVGQNSSLAGNTSASVSLLSTNTVFDGSSFKYITTDAATQYQQNTGAHIWRTAASGSAGATLTFTQVLSVEGSKSLSLQGATPQAGTGITFPATQSASSDANTLDDYEEGTFTPTLTTSGTAGTVTYAAQTGTYTKVGRMVFASIRVFATAWTGSPTGSMFVGGLPFTTGTNGTGQAGCKGYVSFIAHQAGYTDWSFTTNNNATTIQVVECGSNNSAINVPVSSYTSGNNLDINVQAVYFTS